MFENSGYSIKFYKYYKGNNMSGEPYYPSCSRCGGTQHDGECKIDKPLSKIAAMAVDLGDPTLSTTFRKKWDTELRELTEAVQYALDAYDWRVKRGLSAMGKIDSMERLRHVLRSTTTNQHRKCSAFNGETYCRRPVLHEGKCQY
jgi:hypothetical protein